MVAGRPQFQADVALNGDRITAIVDHGTARAQSEIDVNGLIVAPGFIDVHTHDDAALIAHPEMAPKLTQGVATVIAGNCGISASPYRGVADPVGLMRLVFKSDDFVTPTFDEYARKVSDAAPTVNAAFLTGHTTLRMHAMDGDVNRAATRPEIHKMRALLEHSLMQGSLGLSTGLFYQAARAATTDEVIEVARPLKSYEGVLTTHMRDEADGVMDSVRETLQIGLAIEAPVIISHHKCMGTHNFGRSVETLGLLQEAQTRQAVSLDVYPYTAASTVLTKELVDRSTKTFITWSDPHPEFCARDLDAVVRLLNCSRDEALRRLQPAGAIYFVMDESDLQRILRFPKAMIGSDGLPDDQHPHPRLWGTFPRVLAHYVRDLDVLTLEEAVHRMTGLSARQFGVENRGHVAVGQYADLTVFDPRTVRDTATYELPISPSRVICYVFVNGVLACTNGSLSGCRAGKVLRRKDLRDGAVATN
jgi:N-acyl-D-amino-acid deacylase